VRSGEANDVDTSNTLADVDEKNIEYARDNVARNELKSRIRVVKTTPDDPLIQLKAIGAEKYVYKFIIEKADINHCSIDFVMCNPPFYVSREEMLESAKEKSRPPFSVRPNLFLPTSLSNTVADFLPHPRHAQAQMSKW
jgi:tRNA1(Val) A37 N6-methylase TrmN6